MRRREFITLLGGTAVGWPLAVRAQQGERVRRIGVLLPTVSDNPQFQARVGAFLQGLQQSGWTIGHNVRMEFGWTTHHAAAIRRHAAELVALAPDVILAHGGPWGRCCRRRARCQSFSRSSAIRSVPASSIVWGGRAATSPVS